IGSWEARVMGHRHVACAANGHPCSAVLTQQSATPLAAQTPSLCSWQIHLHLLAISDPTDNKRALPGNERSRSSNSDKAEITSRRITTDGRTWRMIANASFAVFAFPLIIR